MEATIRAQSGRRACRSRSPRRLALSLRRGSCARGPRAAPGTTPALASPSATFVRLAARPSLYRGQGPPVSLPVCRRTSRPGSRHPARSPEDTRTPPGATPVRRCASLAGARTANCTIRANPDSEPPPATSAPLSCGVRLRQRHGSARPRAMPSHGRTGRAATLLSGRKLSVSAVRSPMSVHQEPRRPRPSLFARDPQAPFAFSRHRPSAPPWARSARPPCPASCSSV